MGAAGAVGNSIVARRLRSADQAQTAVLLGMRSALSHIGLIGLLILWLSGIYMYISAYGNGGLSPAFHVKLLFATLLVVIAVGMKMMQKRSIKNATPMPKFAKVIVVAVYPLILITVALAAYVFSI